MPWELKSDRPIYTQLIEQIELLIFSGVYPLGSKLPLVRDMAQEAAVNPNTMQRALVKLEEDGLIITHRTSGRSITEDARMVEIAKTKLAQKQISEKPMTVIQRRPTATLKFLDREQLSTFFAVPS